MWQRYCALLILKGILSLYSLSPNITWAAECFQVPKQVAAPRVGLIYKSQLPMATYLRPVTIDFFSPERYIVSIVRRRDQPDTRSDLNPPFDLRLLLKDPMSGQLQEYCRVEKATLPNPFRDMHFFVYSPDATTHDWRLEVIDNVSESTSPQRAAPLTLEIKKFPSLSLEQSDAYSEADAYRWVPRVNLDCKPELDPTAALPVSAPLQQSGEIDPESGNSIIYIRSTGPIVIDFDMEMDTNTSKPAGVPTFQPPFAARVSVKNDTPDPFSASCNSRLGAFGSQPRERFTLRASDQFNTGSPLVWRLELLTPKDVVHRTKFSLYYPTNETLTSTATLPSEFLCASPNPTRGVMASLNDKAFAGATLLSVKINDPEQLLSTSAREAIIRHLLVGMTLWRPVCYLCTPDQLVIANVDGKLYALDILIQALDDFYAGRFDGQPVPRTNSPRDKYFPVLSVIHAKHQPRATPTPIQYVEINSPTPGLLGLCKDNFDELPTSLQRIRLAWGCEAETTKVQMANLKTSTLLSFLTTPLDGCPSGPNTVACESAALKIEFNAKDYRFLSHPENTYLVGKGDRSINLLHVLLHEIGHWIGIGHLSDPGSIMNETLMGSRCIDTATTHALNILASGGLYPVQEPQALLYEESAQSEQRQGERRRY